MVARPHRPVSPAPYVAGGVAGAVLLASAVTLLLPDENRPLPPPGVGDVVRPVKVVDGGHDPLTLERGRVYYVQICLSCHGTRGDGHGEWAYRVTPRPADLRKARTQGRSDQDLFDIISDGLVGTPMIGWKKQLSPEQRWQVIAYLRTLAAPRATQEDS
ncbi:MAG TPA: cytochrome c [Gammaproteobacteria bacterium]|nr:cytochrome c [Gammaproteobacteria bacterium]